MVMSKLFVGLGIVAAATGTLATSLIWTLLSDPARIAVALDQGGVSSLLAAVLGGR